MVRNREDAPEDARSLALRRRAGRSSRVPAERRRTRAPAGIGEVRIPHIALRPSARRRSHSCILHGLRRIPCRATRSPPTGVPTGRARVPEHQDGHRSRPLPPRRAAVRGRPRARARHEPHAGPRGSRAALAGALPRSRRRSRLFRRPRHRAVDSRHVRRAADCSKGPPPRARPNAPPSRRSRRCAACRRSRSHGPARTATHDYRDAEAANVRFHMAIAAAARNTLAQELIERCLAQVDRFMSLGVQFGPFQEGATAAHLEIVDAIARRDPAAAPRAHGRAPRLRQPADEGRAAARPALRRRRRVGGGITLAALSLRARRRAHPANRSGLHVIRRGSECRMADRR